MFTPLAASPSALLDEDDETLNSLSAGARHSAQSGQYQKMTEDSSSSSSIAGGLSTSSRTSPAIMPEQERDGRQISSTGLELSSLRPSGKRTRTSSNEDSSASGLIAGEHPSEARSGLFKSDSPHSLAAAASGGHSSPGGSSSFSLGGSSASAGALNFEVLSLRLRNLMMEDASETQEEELEMTDYDNAEDHVLERKLDEEGSSSAGRGCSGLCARGMALVGIGARDWRKMRLTVLRMIITMIIGVCIGLTGFAVSRAVGAMIHANINILNDMMNKDRPAAAFFVILILSCIYTGVAALFVTFGSWQTRGSGVGRLNAYLSGMSSSRFLALKTLFVKIGGLILNVSAGIKQGMEGPFIHIGAMIGLHVSRFIIWVLNLLFSRWGITKYTQIVAGVVDERMFISGGAAAGFSVAFNAPIAGVLYVQDGAFAYWQGEYTIRTFLCTMTAVTTINMCWKDGDVLPSRGLIDVGSFMPTTITLQEFWGFILLGILGGLMGIAFTKLNVTIEKLRQKHLQKLRLPNVLDVLACTVLTVLLSFILPFLFGSLGCHQERSDAWCQVNPDRCIQFHCGPGKYSDLATFFFTLPEETIRILFDRTPTPEAQIPYQVLIVFCIFYALMACVSYGMAVPGGLFIPSIVIGASYGRLVGLAVQYILPSETGAGVNPGVYAVLGSASMLGGITRMTLPISVTMIEISSDAQFLIPIMLVVLIAKVVADFGCGALYAEHLKLDGLIMVFGDRPPSALKKLLAKDVMSDRAVRKLDVISSVESAWKVIRETKHNAFPVTDSSLATLRSIIQRRRQQQQQADAGSSSMASPNSSNKKKLPPIVKGQLPPTGKRDNASEESKSSSSSSSPSHSTSVSTSGTGVFLGLIQRRHLVYVLTSMPCFSTADQARDSEPMTALPYELALASASAAAAGNGGSRRRSESLTRDESISPSSVGSPSGGEGSNGGLEIVSLSSSSSGGGSRIASPSAHRPAVSHALMHSTDNGAVLNGEGASASASFVEWIARQSAGVGQNMSAVASGVPTPTHAQSQHLAAASIAPTPRKKSPAPHAPFVQQHVRNSSDSASSLGTQPMLASEHDISSSPSLEHGSSISGGNAHLALGQDITVQPSMLNHYVNLSPFIDQGAYTVSENISARRVWALFRSLGMRHIVVLNHSHQPVGVITRRDLIRFAVAQ